MKQYYYHSDNPLKEAIAALTDSEPPSFLDGIHYTRQLNDLQLVAIQDWCCMNTRIPWATGESVLDAADLIVDRAVENCNIHPLSAK